MKGRITLTMLLCFAYYICLSQNSKPAFNRVIEYCLLKTTSNKLYEVPKNSAFIYSIGVSFDEKGLVDTLYFSDDLEFNLKELFMLDQKKTKFFKAINIPFEEYANKIVLITAYHYNREDKFLDYESKFFTQLTKLYPKISTKKPIILYKPYIFDFYAIQ